MKTEQLTYRADGLDMQSWLFVPAGAARRPGVLVFPEVLGLGEHAIDRAERLAELGFVALACDIHGGGRVYADISEVMAISGELRSDPARIRARAQGGLDALLARPEVDTSRIAAIGFCFGGTMALELARSGAPVAGVVGFHSGLSTVAPQGAKDVHAKVLVCIGADDPLIPLAQRTAFEEEMRAAGVDWRLVLYGGVVHSFTDPTADARGETERFRYDARADRGSWAEMQAFFSEIFAMPRALEAERLRPAEPRTFL